LSINFPPKILVIDWTILLSINFATVRLSKATSIIFGRFERPPFFSQESKKANEGFREGFHPLARFSPNSWAKNAKNLTEIE
jgi:hypothetical protein